MCIMKGILFICLIDYYSYIRIHVSLCISMHMCIYVSMYTNVCIDIYSSKFNCRGLIAPHAGYAFSGNTFGYAYQYLMPHVNTTTSTSTYTSTYTSI